MKLLSISLLIVAFTVTTLAQTSPRPRFASNTEANEQRQAATKAAPVAKLVVANIKQEILKLEHEWALALLNENAAKLDLLLADNLQYTRSNGKVENKSTYLEPIKKGITTYSMVKREHVKIQVNGETAIVTAQWRAKLQNKPNPPLETKARYLHVYMKQNGRWVLTAHQNTEIK